MNFSSMNLQCENRVLKQRISKLESDKAITELINKKEKEKSQALRKAKKEE